MTHIILLQPRIPQNTGNIGRLCVAAQAKLHLIHPLGFHLDDKYLKRAGMDYWEYLDLKEWDCVEDFWECYPLDCSHYFFSTKAKKIFYEARFQKECFLYFGREDAGIDEVILKDNEEKTFKIPMSPKARSLNLATTVGIALYEAIRQNGLQQ